MFKKAFLISLLILILVLNLCSWVDRSSMDVYSGVVVGGPFGTAPCEYYLDSYDGLGLSEAGSLISSKFSKNGFLYVNGASYEFVLSPPASCKLVLNGQYEDFTLIPDQLPTSLPFPVFVGLFAVLLVLCVILLMFIGRGVLL